MPGTSETQLFVFELRLPCRYKKVQHEVLFAHWSVNDCNCIIFTLFRFLASSQRTQVSTVITIKIARVIAVTNMSTHVSHQCDRVCHVSIFYDT